MTAKIYVVPTDTCLGIWCRIDDSEWYSLIYELKWRDKNKQLAILVPTWEDLAYETSLTSSQINFLKTYKFPFTIICDVRDDFRDEYPLLDEYNYKTLGFRVAEVCLPTETQSYIRAPLFLTSANKSWEKECNTIDEVNHIFRDNRDALKILPGSAGNQPSSNVIQFIWTTNDLKYIRKNYPLK
jgi:tRNA A37 threonylcarbamoyladenosine synthetase subunit TsaC/SUA5/YrdC